MNRFLEQLMPFIIFGILITLFVFGIILFWTVLIWGAALGLILYSITMLRVLWFRWRARKYGEKGIIEHDEDE